MLHRWLCAACLFCALTVCAAELTPAVAPEGLDAAQCLAFEGGRALGAAPMPVLLWRMGLAAKPNGERLQWSTGPLPGRARHFRLAFTKPVALGTIVTTYDGGRSEWTLFQTPSGTRVSYLKPAAPYPGDVTRDDLWVTLPPGEVKTLPPGTTTRALRFSEYTDSWISEARSSTFPVALLFAERYYTPLLLGVGKELPGAKNMPNRWIGLWTSEPLPVAGVVFTGGHADEAQVEVLKPAAAEHPLSAPGKEWRRLKDVASDGGPQAYSIDPPAPTRAVRVYPQNGGGDFSYTMGQAIPLVNLGDAASPPLPMAPTPPIALNYTMPMDGFIAINIDDKKTGKHIRRLIAEVPHLQGAVREPWDLKDDHGQYVPPGDYTWSAIARPPLKLTYENTVNNAGQPPWFAPPPGKGGGGWMADHTPPHAVCAVGDYMFLGSACAESGHAMIATDLDGNKVWGEPSIFGGFLGVRRYAGDGRYAYMINGSGILRLDTQNGLKHSEVKLDIKYTREVPGPGSGWGEYLSGAAARDGKLYLAFNAPAVSWIQSAFTPEDVNLMGCLPSVRRVRGSKPDAYREGEFDEVQQFHSVFLDGGAASANRNTWGEAPKSGPLAGSLTVIFKKPQPVGTVLLQDPTVKVYALKPGAKLPDAEPENLEPDANLDGGDGELDANPFDEQFWMPLATTGKAGLPALAQTGKGLTTQALRFKTDRVKFALVMSHRFADVAGDAERVCTDGTLTPKGGWAVTRDPKTRIISAYDPASCALVWKEPVSLRGVTLVGMTEAKTAVDYWIGPANGDPKAALTDDSQWKQAAVLEAEMHGPYPQTPAARSVDFGANVTTRAVRVRAIAPKGDTGYMGYRGVPVSGPHQAGFESIVAYRHLGQDPELPQELNERLSVFQLPDDPEKSPAALLRHLPLAAPGDIAFSPDGTLYAWSAGRLVTVPLDGGDPKEVLAKGVIEKPAGIAFDADGRLYAVDRGPRVVRVFDLKAGKQVGAIGTPGGPKLGTWSPQWFTSPDGVAVDKLGKVWVAESDLQPKRISRWTRDGKLEKSFLGPCEYGSGGWMDPQNRAILNYHGMKFVIDWQTRDWKLDSILFRPGMPGSGWGAMPDRPLYVKGKRYLAGDPGRDGAAMLCVERNNVAVPLVTAGNLAIWDAVDAVPELRKAFGTLNRGDYGFLWQDQNGDAVPQAAEVQTSRTQPLKGTYWPSRIGDDLSLNFSGVRLRPTGARPDGTPTYDLAKAEAVPALGISWTAADGRAFVVEDRMLAPDGKTTLWDYPDNYLSVHGSHNIGYDRPPGVLVGEHHVNGHFEVNGEELFVTNGNHGDWFAFTRDGLLAGCIFGGPLNYGKRFWFFPEWEKGKTNLSDLNVQEEHFGGSITKTEDGKVYAVAGHNHNSVVRVDGLEKMQRLGGAMSVTAADVEKTMAWDLQRAALAGAREEPKVMRVPYVEKPMAVDAALEDWPEPLWMSIHQHLDVVKKKMVTDTEAALAYDADNLYVAARVSDDSPLTNSAPDLANLFKHGDAVEVDLGLNPAADPKRPGPTTGDLRILISRVKGEPVVMVYRYVVAGVPEEKRKWYVSPITKTPVDVVAKVDGVEVVVKEGERGDYELEASIPWKGLGEPAPAVNSRLRGDVGVLLGDRDGVRTVQRWYWSGKSQTIVSDLAFEARLAPLLWGELDFAEPDESMHFGPEEVDIGL